MNNEIKVMNNDEIRDFCIKKDLRIFELEQELQQKQNIIKEVREYIKEWQRFPHTNGSTHRELKNLIDILDKEK